MRWNLFFVRDCASVIVLADRDCHDEGRTCGHDDVCGSLIDFGCDDCHHCCHEDRHHGWSWILVVLVVFFHSSPLEVLPFAEGLGPSLVHVWYRSVSWMASVWQRFFRNCDSCCSPLVERGGVFAHFPCAYLCGWLMMCSVRWNSAIPKTCNVRFHGEPHVGVSPPITHGGCMAGWPCMDS